jgi:tRNA-binding protein
MEQITWEEFTKVGLCIGTIVKVEDFPEANKPAYKIEADFGKYGFKKSSARITDLYTKEELVGKQIIAVINFPPKQIGPFVSEFLTTGFYRDDGQVVLAVPDKSVPNGSQLG